MTKSGENKNVNKIVAQRYANALMELSNKEISKDDILSQITDVKESLNNSDDLQKIMSSPIVSNKEKKDIIDKIFKSVVNKSVLNFLKLLIDKNRFEIFDSIVTEYKNEVNRQNGLIDIKITSAIDLNNNERAMIKVKLEKVLNREIELNWGVNKDIIGGLIFEVNDDIIDCSLQHKLQEIKKEITRGK